MPALNVLASLLLTVPNAAKTLVTCWRELNVPNLNAHKEHFLIGIFYQGLVLDAIIGAKIAVKFHLIVLVVIQETF